MRCVVVTSTVSPLADVVMLFSMRRSRPLGTPTKKGSRSQRAPRSALL